MRIRSPLVPFDKIMSQKQKLNPSLVASKQIAGAIFAPIVFLGITFTGFLISADVFHPNKDLIMTGCLLSPVIAAWLGIKCYSLFAPESGSELVANSQCSVRAKLAWTSAFAYQLIACFSLCIIVGFDFDVFPRPYQRMCWFGFNVLNGISVLICLASVFWIHKDIGNRATLTIWNLMLFTLSYLVFFMTADWLADPYSIPNKIAW